MDLRLWVRSIAHALGFSWLDGGKRLRNRVVLASDRSLFPSSCVKHGDRKWLAPEAT